MVRLLHSSQTWVICNEFVCVYFNIFIFDLCSRCMQIVYWSIWGAAWAHQDWDSGKPMKYTSTLVASTDNVFVPV